jgi:hypothetical protein
MSMKSRITRLSLLLIAVCATALYLLLSVLNFLDRPLYYDRFALRPNKSLVPQWWRTDFEPGVANDGSLIFRDRQLNHVLIYKPSDEQGARMRPHGRVIDGRWAEVYVGSGSVRFDARDKQVVIDDTPRVLLSTPMSSNDQQ